MKKNCKLLTVMAFLCASYNVSAQTDSLLDLGRIKVNKHFTQSVTIKGSDLLKMPFADLTDAIAPWLQGELTNANEIVYVIDGNIINDVNAYPVYDIDEIVLVQNALIGMNGAWKQQHLVLIKTKLNKRADNFTIAGSSFVVDNKYTTVMKGFKSESNLYHQFHLGAKKKFNDNLSIGLSANYLRDINPRTKSTTTNTEAPPNFNRFRINGWLDATLADGHNVMINLNFVPQTYNFETRSIPLPPQGFAFKFKQTLFNPTIKLSNRLAKGLSNELDVSYLVGREPQSAEQITTTTPLTVITDDAKVKTDLVLVRERLSYRKSFGKWEIGPALNFTWRSIKRSSFTTRATRINNVVAQIDEVGFSEKFENLILTPAFSVTNTTSFYAIVGVTANLDKEKTPVQKGVFPFASASLDVLRINDKKNKLSLRIFGSYSRSARFNDYSYSQLDVVSEGGLLVMPVSVFSSGLMGDPYPADDKFHQISAGAVFTTEREKLQLSYNFDNRQFNELAVRFIPTPTGTDFAGYWPDFVYSSHRLGVQAKVIDESFFLWRSGLNVSTFKTTVSKNGSTIYPEEDIVNNYDKTALTGGWVNRFQYHDFFCGLDLLYLLNERRFMGGGEFDNVSSFSISNFYAGYKVRVMHQPLEFYIGSRNGLQSSKAYFRDTRRFFGLGFSWKI